MVKGSWGSGSVVNNAYCVTMRTRVPQMQVNFGAAKWEGDKEIFEGSLSPKLKERPCLKGIEREKQRETFDAQVHTPVHTLIQHTQSINQ